MSLENKEQRDNEDLPLHLKVALGLVAFLILASCFSRQLAGSGADFSIFYKAAGQILNWQSPFRADNYDYNHLPSIATFFGVFHLFSYETARWVYAALHASLALALPYLLYTILRSQKDFSIRHHKETYVMGILVSFLGTFRFIDSEFHISQINLWLATALLLGVWTLQHFAKSKIAHFFAISLWTVACFIRFNFFSVFLVFIKSKKIKTLSFATAIITLWVLLPNPLWVGDTISMIKEYWYEILHKRSPLSFQGFVAFGRNILGYKTNSLVPFFLGVPFAAWAIFKIPRFKTTDFQANPIGVLLSMNVWMLWALMVSPEAAHHSYSLLWIMVPLMWIAANTIEKRWIFAICIFLGFSPQGLVGKSISTALEAHQGIFVAILILWIILVKIASRRTLRSSIG